MAVSRKDNKGRVLRKGETQRSRDKMYVYTYTGADGKRHSIYNKDITKLREREDRLIKALLDGMDMSGVNTLDSVFDKYITFKSGIKADTIEYYTYMYNHYVRGCLISRKRIEDVVYSDLLRHYQYLLNERKLKISSVEVVQAIIHQTFKFAVKDNLIRNNPSDDIMSDVKYTDEQSPLKKHALTPEQQQAFIRYIERNIDFCYIVPIIKFLMGTGCRIGDDDDKIRLNQRKPSKYKGLSRFGPEKNLQRINKFMKERPIFYKNLIQMKENFRFYLRCFYCITKVVILQFNSENRTELARNG